jgi:periplasmic protein CpxP/Spy
LDFVIRTEEKKMKARFAIGFGLATMLLAGMTAAAQGPGMGPGMGQGMGGPGFGMHRPPMERALGMREGRWWNDPAMVEKLKLSDDQRKSMDKILLDHREQLVDMRAAVEKAELEMEPLVQDDSPNEARILAQIDKVAQARAELEKANARFLLAIRGKLSPEQWKGLKEARAERMGRIDRRGWRDRRDGSKPQGPPPSGGPAGGPQGLLNEIPAPDGPDDGLDTGTR